MSPSVKTIQSDAELPAFADVVIVGGGIVGSAAAYYLARRGVSVALIEKGYIGCEQSSRSWGWCRQQNRDARELPLSGVAMRLWDRLAEDIGEDLGFRRCGLVYATDDARQLAEWDNWRETASQFGVNTRMLSAAEAEARIPAPAHRRWLGGVHSIDDGKGEPSLAAPVLAGGARRQGATIHQDCAAHGLEIANRAVKGVHTDRGFVGANAVLCAAGAWASSFCHQHGVRFPQASVRQTAVRTVPMPNVGDVLYTPDCALTRRLDGSYTMAISGRATLEITPQSLRFAGPFLPMFAKRLKAVQIGVGHSFLEGPESLATWRSRDPARFGRMRVLDPKPDPRLVAEIIARVRRQFPAFGQLELADAWGAYVDSTPDAVPVISAVESVAGLFLAAGCSGHGFGVGPAIGLLSADLITNQTPCVDASPFQLGRLLDGSRIEVGAI